MAQEVTLSPTAGASTNPLGITFGATATMELLNIPEKIMNKNISGIELVKIDTTGIYVHKGPFNAIIPWSNIISFIY